MKTVFWRARDKLEVDDRLRMCKEKRRMGGFYVMLIPLEWVEGPQAPAHVHWMLAGSSLDVVHRAPEVIPTPMARIPPLHYED